MQYPHVKFSDVCEIISTRGHQILQSEIKTTGIYPVVSQSENLIEGYSDFKNPITKLPLVLFGDHTCCVKIIKKPFVVGADGTKLFFSHKHEIKFLFLYLQLCAEKLIDGKYRRHFSDLCKFDIPLPPLPIQQEIVARLEKELAKVDEMAESFKRMAELADEEFKSVLSETFEHVDGKHIRFESICKTVSTRGHQILQSEINKVGKYPVISQSENLIEGYSDFDNPIMEVPLVLFGDHTCCVKKIEKPFVVGADGTKLLYSDIHTIDFLYYFLVWCSPKLTDGKYRRHFSDLSKMEIPLLDISTQQIIVSKLECAKNKSFKIKT